MKTTATLMTMSTATLTTMPTRSDTDCIAFGPVPGLEPFVDAARKVAADIGRPGHAHACASAQGQAAERVRALDVQAAFAELHASGEALPLLFQMARTLGHANVAAAWAGLAGAPAALLGEEFAGSCIAQRLPAGPAQAPRWALWLPLGDGGRDPCIAWFDPASGALHGPVPLSQGPFACTRSEGLLGLPLASLITLQARAQAAATPARPCARPHAAAACDQARLALLLGLIDGACERLAQEAYAYAKERRSAGKPISQHQAVALRLADIASNQQALALYLAAAIERHDAFGADAGLATLSVAHVADLAFRISRDAVQIAAAHGYVEGLPFKRLFEQVGTLSGVLATCQPCLAHASCGPLQ